MTVTDERRAEIEAEERVRQEIRQRVADDRWQEAGRALPIVALAIIIYAAGKWLGL